ncbi:hypothetical protein Pse7367_1448 [Thalassoporum mexicanum PCC 7367]|uniref:hypothetical protein n=1 Tax=Thalassoporum mexicanum TaxID=3457544 RepID=UPI00029F9D9B|nr:hypothetical protein [Pseudanabaena sp. PCC 7367]AFY69739.1 hypothetical protein Pse7367_1448 [Pseudanabaena sp. PCC 7367]
MKKLLILPLLAIACLIGGSTELKWNGDELANAQSNCTDSALESNPNAKKAQAQYFCSCTLTQAAQRWDYEDFAFNESAYVTELAEAGVIGQCVQEALQLEAEATDI